MSFTIDVVFVNALSSSNNNDVDVNDKSTVLILLIKYSIGFPNDNTVLFIIHNNVIYNNIIFY